VVSLDVPDSAVPEEAAGAPVVSPLTDDFSVLHARWHDARAERVLVLAADAAAVRLALPVLPSLGLTRQVDLRLPASELEAVRVSEPAPGGRVTSVAIRETAAPLGAEVAISLRAPTDLRTVLGDLVTGGCGRSAVQPASGLRVAAADAGALAWCVGDPSSRTSANADASWRGDETRGAPADVVLQSRNEPAPRSDAVIADVASRCPPVDIGVANPAGFDSDPGADIGYLVVTDVPDGQEVRVTTAYADVAQFGKRGRLSATVVNSLRGLTYVDATAVHHAEPSLAAHVVAQLGASGVPLVTKRLPPAVASLLHPDAVAALAEVSPESMTDDEQREANSVRVRRAILRRHSHSGTWRELRASLGFDPSPALPVSVQLVTKRRQFLKHAVRSVAQQRNVDVELVLVTHGFTLSDSEIAELEELLPFPLVTANIRDDAYFGDALNLALSRASGALVAKMDDDDWYGPHHLEDLIQTLGWSGATLAGAVHQYTYLADIDVTVRRRVSGAKRRRPAHVPGGTMLLRREDLLGVGGWRPLRQAGPEDLALSHAVRESGGTLQETHGMGFVLCRHGRGHTWNVSSERFLESADQQWPGFHAPPELGDGPVTRDHYAHVHAAARAAAAEPTAG